MKKKLFLVVLLAIAAATTLSAQISQGDPTATTIKTGNRPEKGDFGVFFGGGMLINSRENYILPVMNFKYFATDHLELRAGIDLFRRGNRSKGKVIKGDVMTDPLVTYDGKNVTVQGIFDFTPGFAYHFSSKNILDVYVGAEIPIGFENWRVVTSTTGANAPTDQSSVVTRIPFVIGGNLLLGIQAFIGNLPLAIGLEYGIGAKAFLGDKYKVVVTQGENHATYYRTSTPEQPGVNYERLSRLSGYIDHTVRLTLSYYFN